MGREILSGESRALPWQEAGKGHVLDIELRREQEEQVNRVVSTLVTRLNVNVNEAADLAHDLMGSDWFERPADLVSHIQGAMRERVNMNEERMDEIKRNISELGTGVGLRR